MDTNTLDILPTDEKREILGLIEELNAARKREGAQEDFLEFVKEVWPAFIEGDHHRVMADAFNRIAPSSEVGSCWYWALHLPTGSSAFRASS